MKTLEKNKAIKLRKQGRTFGEILQEIPVSKGSLSYWLRDIPLTLEQLERIEYKNEQIKEKFIKFNELRKNQSAEEKRTIFGKAAGDIETLSQKELKLIGIALYWAEGYNKNSNWKTVSFTNSDPRMITLMMRWFRIICEIPEDKFRIRIQCYGERQAGESEKFWSKITNIPLSQFTKSYVRISPTSRKKVGILTPHGVCNIRISDTALLTKIKGWIQGLNGAIV